MKSPLLINLSSGLVILGNHHGEGCPVASARKVFRNVFCIHALPKLSRKDEGDTEPFHISPGSVRLNPMVDFSFITPTVFQPKLNQA